MKAVKFFNNTKEDFSWKWDGEVYSFKAGEIVMLQDYLANHFAKHLAVRELNKRSGTSALVNEQNMVPLMQSFIITDDVVEATSEAKLEVELLKEDEKKEGKECCGSKGVRHKKDCPTLKVEEDSFEGLSE